MPRTWCARYTRPNRLAGWSIKLAWKLFCWLEKSLTAKASVAVAIDRRRAVGQHRENSETIAISNFRGINWYSVTRGIGCHRPNLNFRLDLWSFRRSSRHTDCWHARHVQKLMQNWSWGMFVIYKVPNEENEKEQVKFRIPFPFLYMNGKLSFLRSIATISSS